MTLENTILAHLIFDESFTRKVLPYLQPEYFSSSIARVAFLHIQKYILKYNKLPPVEALIIGLDNEESLGDEQQAECLTLIKSLKESTYSCDPQWLLDGTEKFCQERAIYNGISEAIRILDGKEKKKGKGAIPQILSDALAVSFDTNIGHDFLKDSDERWKFYHDTEVRVPFDIDYFNKVTKGGLPKKTLNIILAGVGIGKSAAMCHMAAGHLYAGLNVLYITLEMQEKLIAQRIDANLLNVSLDDLILLPKDVYDKKMDALRTRTPGKLIIKEYPTAQAGAGHFRHLFYECKLKANFVPDVVYIDYLNLCISSRIRYGTTVNSYSYIKSIAEEIRGLAVESNVPIISATQFNREGYSDSDPGMEQVAESFGLPATADFMIALVTNDELEKLNQLMVKQLKNRYQDVSKNKYFVVGFDKTKMRLYNCEETAQKLTLREDVLEVPPNTKLFQ